MQDCQRPKDVGRRNQSSRRLTAAKAVSECRTRVTELAFDYSSVALASTDWQQRYIEWSFNLRSTSRLHRFLRHLEWMIQDSRLHSHLVDRKNHKSPEFKLRLFEKAAISRQAATNSALSESECASFYQYGGLPSERTIRLLRIHPGAYNSVIECSMEMCSLDSPSSYEALSYAWGDDLTNTHSLSCEGRSLVVTDSVWRALHRLRPEAGDPLVIWIDAICINQASLEERNAQVLLMPDIYRGARSVKVWLGEEANSSNDGMDLIQAIADQRATLRENNELMTAQDLVEVNLPVYNDSSWKALDAIYWRPWFTRAWIVQEITLAKDAVVICGQKSVSWDNLVCAAICLDTHNLSQLVRVDTWRPIQLGSYAYHLEFGMDLLGLLHRTRLQHATRPHDKVYSVLGLARDAAGYGLEVDYGSSVVKLYSDLAIKALKRSQHLAILHAACDPAWNLVDGLPSWVPDWSALPRASALVSPEAGFGLFATKDAKAQLRFSDDTLYAEGVFVDQVVRICSPAVTIWQDRFQPGFSTPGMEAFQYNIMASRWCQWEHAALSLERYPTGQSVEECLHRTLIADSALPNGAHSSAETLAMYYNAYRKYFMTVAHGGFTPLQHEVGGDASTRQMAAVYNRAFKLACWGRRFFLTKHGYMGLGPFSTRPGDRIAVLLGGRTPYVLRKVVDKKHKETHFRLIGESYVHGLMHGEALDVHDEFAEIAIR